jgi:hypothetical protein
MANEYLGEGLNEIISERTGAVNENITGSIKQYLIDDDTFNEGFDGSGRFFSDDYAYNREFSGNVSQSLWWNEFRRRIQFDQRFFNSVAKDLLIKIFDKVHLQKDINRTSPILQLKPDAGPLYRARIVHSDGEEEKTINDPAENLGPPPEQLRKQGRMNAPGILAFYGAFEAETCITELRPPVGCRVAVAAFDLARPLTLLDTTCFQAPPKDRNIFSTSYNERMSQWLFMQRFMSEISEPIQPGDEVFEYIPTQVVAEYLVNHHDFGRGKIPKSIDGIVFKSAQRSEDPGLYHDLRNIVLFDEAAIVEQTLNAKSHQSTGASRRISDERNEAISPGLRYRTESLSIRIVSGIGVSTRSPHDPADPNEPPPYYR